MKPYDDTDPKWQSESAPTLTDTECDEIMKPSEEALKYGQGSELWVRRVQIRRAYAKGFAAAHAQDDQRPGADGRMVGGKTNAEPSAAEGHPIATQSVKSYNHGYESNRHDPLPNAPREYHWTPEAAALYLPDAPPAQEDGLVAAMRERARIRRSIPRGEPDRISDQLEAAADRIAALERDQSLAFSALEREGVPKERTRSVANGINVLAQRWNKYEQAAERKLEYADRRNDATNRHLREAIQDIAEMKRKLATARASCCR